ncbi:MAG: hypothetical protein GF417_11285, partial [Candidatus Latescibacteria bacterium]|nr:hypothetical protein [Candidatus Latescibacterota bacterium]
CEEKKEGVNVTSGIAARVGGEEITNQEVDKRFKALPKQQQREFSGDIGRVRLIDQMIEEKLVYRAALDNKLQYKDQVKQQLDYSREMILNRAYYSHLADQIEVTDSEVKDYYESHPIEFKAEPTLRAQHIFTTDSLKAVEWIERIESSEDKYIFNKLAKEESEDSSTAKDLGNLGYFHPGGYIKFIGFDSNFGNTVAWMEEGEISDVIPHKRGYSVVKLNEKKDADLRPLDVVSTKIREKLKQEKIQKMVPRKIDQLYDQYEAENLLRKKLLANIRSPREFWEMAQEETDPKQKIFYYRSIAQKYPDDKLASQALFMVAFTYAEEIGDISFAKRAIKELLKKYPDSEIAESAKWLRENLGTKALKFDSVEEMEREMGKESQEN